MLYGSKLLAHVEFPTSEVLGPGASEDEIQALIDGHGLIVIKPSRSPARTGQHCRKHVPCAAFRLGKQLRTSLTGLRGRSRGTSRMGVHAAQMLH
jgi:hypothetical protein